MPLDLPRIRGLCFDIDGTLADTDDHLVQQLARLLDRLPFLSGREAERLARRTVMRATPPVNDAYGLLDRLHLDAPVMRLRRQVTRLRRRNLRATDENPHDMMAGVQEMLKKLSARYPMSTISTGGQERVERFLDRYKVRGCFAAVVTAQTTRRMKPHPEALRHAAEAMGVPPEACLMIGDTTVDIRTGRSAGAQTVGVLCGFGTQGELERAGADLILKTTSDLLPVLMPAEDKLQQSAEPATAPGPTAVP
ncbi:MAG TPA: HAD family hydrolase [Rubricoccaceae bacterium]|nr:HAD family hydrolase [Rubricoccaceae bacterium]